MLKFEGIPVGTIIKSFSFQPIPGRASSYMIGEVTGTTLIHGAKMYRCKTIKEVFTGIAQETPEEEFFAPMQCGFMEYDERITVVG